jgi:peptidoglycan-associated lipoprotein
MKRNHTNTRGWHVASLSIAAGLLLGLAGCKHTTASASSSEPVAQPAPAPAPEPAPAPAAEPAPQPAQAAVEIPVETQSVFFDYDRSDVNAEGQQFLSQFGALLAKHPELEVRIEGNCDERGTAQYNIALGQRRADSARKYLVQMGASDAQLTTISYGKERPRATGHGEKAWRENRRADFVPDRQTVSANP